MKRPLFDIWEDMDDIGPSPWRVQMINYVAEFTTKTQAEKFVAATERARKQDAKKIK